MEEGFEIEDPQDGAILSRDMCDRKPVQRHVACRSVFEGLSELGKTHGKIYGTNGKRADMLRFDLTSHSVYAGNTFIVCRGELVNGEIETAEVRIDMRGLPWLTEEERKIDPTVLFDEHYVSRPNGSERFMACNFPAKDCDDMTDDEITKGIPRAEARIRLEAWMLCAGIDGTLERLVTGSGTWRDGDRWWSPSGYGASADGNGSRLVVRTDWWLKRSLGAWRLSCGSTVTDHAGAVLCTLSENVDPNTARTIQSAEELRLALVSLSDAVFRMQLRLKAYDCEQPINNANRILRYIERGL